MTSVRVDRFNTEDVHVVASKSKSRAKSGLTWVPVERLKPIIERHIADRQDYAMPGMHHRKGSSGLRRTAWEIALNQGLTMHSVERQLRNILTGWHTYTPKPVINGKKRPATSNQLKILEEEAVEYKEGITAHQAFMLLDSRVQRRPYKMVTFDWADKILCGLHLNGLWHTELRDIYYQGLEEEE